MFTWRFRKLLLEGGNIDDPYAHDAVAVVENNEAVIDNDAPVLAGNLRG